MIDDHFDRHHGVTDHSVAVQARPSRSGFLASTRSVLSAGLSAWVLLGCAGCASVTANPVAWFHDLQGGAIAEQRPAPPLADAPYPNLATVPARPPLPDAQKRAVLMAALAADRSAAQADAARVPLVAVAIPAHPTPAPAPAGDPDDSSSAQMAAASAPAPRMAPASQQASTASGGAVDPTAPSPTISATDAAIAKLSGAEKVSHPVAEGTPAADLASLPELAAAPPPLPDFAHPIAPATTPAPSIQLAQASPAPVPPTDAAPATPDQTAAAPASPPPAPRLSAASTSVEIGFDPNSDTLPGSALAQLKLLSRTRGLGTIIVTGHGDVDGTDAQTQAAGLPLALARARAIAAYLMATGVPPGAVTITAEAQGHGGVARISN